jgi:hypothetical protein
MNILKSQKNFKVDLEIENSILGLAKQKNKNRK